MKPKQFPCRFTYTQLSDMEEYLKFLIDAKLSDHPNYWPYSRNEELFSRLENLHRSIGRRLTKIMKNS